MTAKPNSRVFIGTSGSTDYLKNGTDERRFWPVVVASIDDASEVSLVEGQGKVCDGLHDESLVEGQGQEDAPASYLCSRCFPDRQRDLAKSQDAYDDVRDEQEEME